MRLPVGGRGQVRQPTEVQGEMTLGPKADAYRHLGNRPPGSAEARFGPLHPLGEAVLIACQAHGGLAHAEEVRRTAVHQRRQGRQPQRLVEMVVYLRLPQPQCVRRQPTRRGYGRGCRTLSVRNRGRGSRVERLSAQM